MSKRAGPLRSFRKKGPAAAKRRDAAAGRKGRSPNIVSPSVPGQSIRIAREDERYLNLTWTRTLLASYAGAVEPTSRAAGRLYVGTSGFAYADWAPRFYATGTRGEGLLRAYADRLNTCELNNTFYQHPKADRIATWVGATPQDFRFVVKAQRGGSMRAFGEAAAQTVGWLTAPYRLFEERLGAVLFRVPENIHRDLDKLRTMLAAWPSDMPLVAEFQHTSWHDDEVYDLLRAHSAVLCATDLDDRAAPDLHLTGNLIYLRLRRTSYTDDELASWANRLEAFLADGVDCFVFLRHDETGESAVRAVRLREMLGRV